MSFLMGTIQINEMDLSDHNVNMYMDNRDIIGTLLLAFKVSQILL